MARVADAVVTAGVADVTAVIGTGMASSAPNAVASGQPLRKQHYRAMRPYPLRVTRRRPIPVVDATPPLRAYEAPRVTPHFEELESRHEAPIVRVQPEEVRARPESQPVVEAEPRHAQQPVVEPERPHHAPQLPRVTLELPPESGLVLVETSHVAPPVAEAEEAQRPRRVRPPRAAIADEPLQLVETAPKDSTPPAAE